MRYVVLGGGIAGVCCALELARCLQHHGTSSPTRADEPNPTHIDEEASKDQIILVSSSSVLKGVREVARLTRLVEELEVVEIPLESLSMGEGPGGLLKVVQGVAVGLDLQNQVLHLHGGCSLRYDKLCLCTGARPKELEVPGAHHPAVLTLRDTDSVEELSRRLRGCRRLLLVGNGGIALELAGALMQLEAPHPSHLPHPSLAAQPPIHAGGEGVREEGRDKHGEGQAPVIPAQGTTEFQGTSEAVLGVLGCVAGMEVEAARLGVGVRAAPRELVWVLKHGHVGDAFFDVDAAQFLLEDRLQRAATDTEIATATEVAPEKGCCCGGYVPGCMGLLGTGVGGPAAREGKGGAGHVAGHAVGPAWTQQLLRGMELSSSPRPSAGLMGAVAVASEGSHPQGPGGDSDERLSTAAAGSDGGGGCGAVAAPAGFRLVLEFSTTVQRIDDGLLVAVGATEAAAEGGDDVTRGVEELEGVREEGAWPIYVTLSNGKVYGADLVVCGVGVVPATEWLPSELTRHADGGLAVCRDLCTSDAHVFAAGDCCTADWPDGSPHWFQMRLWTQARVMGTFAAHSILGLTDEMGSSFNFELFTHVTRFLGAKVVLLGLYNGQRLEDVPKEDIQIYSRANMEASESGNTFVRVLLYKGRLQGAVLIGETELEEALENIILDGLDLTSYGYHILDEGFELDHIFD